ncbi:MAG: hypothetical protein IJF61_01380 [Clostridia bacterium]|nr:hypothetical protein [Clostridia bacterium]
MLENFYTTKMSMDKKKLQNRFSKIRSKSGRVSKLMAFVIFAAVLLIMAILSLIIAATVNRNDYAMTENEFSDYINRPIGSIMAELDYVDDHKLVFHYLEGFFIINQETNEIDHMINLKKLNVSQHQQGSTFLEIKVDKAGTYAYLSSVGPADEIKGYETYIINLDNGEVKKGKMPKNTELFTGKADTLWAVQNPVGWYSNNCIVNKDKTYYLTSEAGKVIDIQLVTIYHNNEDMTGYNYVFSKYYVSDYRKKQNLIQERLSDDEEILINSGLSWEVNADVVKSVFDKLRETNQMKYIDVKDGNYDITIYQIWKNDISYPRLYVIDNYSIEILFSTDLREEEHNSIVSILNRPTSQLYQKTSEYLKQEFYRVYKQYYDIQSLTISNWQESGNEATFHYNMTYLYYNRDPDKLAYIQEAKKQGHEKYETLYNDYLALKQANHEFKVVLNGDTLELYSNVAPKGTEWVPIKIDDYVRG